MQHPIDDTAQLAPMQNPANDAPKMKTIDYSSNRYY